MTAILETPQYVAYQKNVVYAFIKVSAKSHSCNILCTMDGLSCRTKYLKVFWSSRNGSFVFNQIFVYGTLMGVDYKSEKKI